MKKLIAKDLLSIGAVFFRLTSPLLGMRHQKPRLLRQPPDPHRCEGPGRCGNALAENVKPSIPRCEVLMGTSTPARHAAIVAISWAAHGLCPRRQQDHGRNKPQRG
jgi:orotate phosphoribosyltransferase